MKDSKPPTATFSLEDLSRQVLSNTATYWSSVKSSSNHFKLQVCQEVAAACLDSGLKLSALAALSILERLPIIDPQCAHSIPDLRAEIDRERPWANFLPTNFSIVTSLEDKYYEILSSGLFPSREIAFRTTELGQRLYHMAAFGSPSDISFILLRKLSPQVHVRCGVHLDEGVTDYLAPVQIRTAATLTPARRFHAIEAALDVLAERGVRAGAANILVQDEEIGPNETDIGRAVRLRSYDTNLCISLAVDLSADDRSQWLSIRKSFRPLISSSAKIINLRYFNSTIQDEYILHNWKLLRGMTEHSLTESLVELIVNMIRHGMGEITAGFSSDDSCVGVVVILDDCGKSLYYCGHFVEDSNNRRHSHFMLYDAIRRAKARGSDRFYLSYFDNYPNIYVSDGIRETPNLIIENIRYFMRGFANLVERHLTYRKPL